MTAARGATTRTASTTRALARASQASTTRTRTERIAKASRWGRCGTTGKQMARGRWPHTRRLPWRTLSTK
ncbi:MAG: hypothetical protein ACK55Z_18125, partial [bacterium]